MSTKLTTNSRNAYYFLTFDEPARRVNIELDTRSPWLFSGDKTWVDWAKKCTAQLRLENEIKPEFYYSVLFELGPLLLVRRWRDREAYMAQYWPK